MNECETTKITKVTNYIFKKNILPIIEQNRDIETEKNK